MAEGPGQPPRESTTRIDGNVDGDVLSGTFNGAVTIMKAVPVQPIVLTPQESRNRQAMIDKVRRFWITDYLKHSLIEEVQIALDLADRPGVTITPTNLAARLPGQAADRLLPPGTSIASVYDDQAQALLILGAPGAGKTTLLLELAETLLGQAKQDPTHPIPVVFNLSSWGESRPAFDVWLVEQLNLVYDVPKKLAQPWIAQGLILPLLDGLDEVASNRRAACVEAINGYRQHEAGLQPLVICCREAEYQALPPLRLHGAVVVQPLTQPQIEDYLSQLGPSVAPLRAAVQRHSQLVEMLTTPLMLNIVTLVYRGEQAPSLVLARSEDEWRNQVFTAYVALVLQRRQGGLYPESRIRNSLAWLAWQMEQRSQSVFLIENLQPDWLQTLSGRRCYGIVSLLALGLVGGLVGGFVLEWLAGWTGGLAGGMFIGLIIALVTGPTKTITFMDRVHWSWSKAYKSLFSNLPSVLIMGLSIGLLGKLEGEVNGEPVSWPVLWLTFGLGFALVITPITGLVNGFNTIQIESRFHTNQGIWRSFQSGLIFWLVFGLVFGLGFRPLVDLAFGLVVKPIFGVIGVEGGLSSGLVLGLMFGLLGVPILVGGKYGGRAALQHLILRILLWRSGTIPWNLAAFLDTCADRILLRKVGGGYVFIHRLLLEWFAAQYQPGQGRQGDG